MIIEKFLQDFELLTDTQVGIKRLREVILKVATQGLIVNQDPNDGSILQDLNLIDSAEVGERLNADLVHLSPYPSSWATARFPNIGKWIGGHGFPTSEQGHKGLDILFCKVSDMNLPSNSRFILEATNTIDLQTAKKLRVNILPEGTVIFPKIGGAIATNKRRLISKPTVMDNNCMGLVPSSVIDPEWLFLLLSSIDMTQYQSGTSIPSLSQRILDQITFGVPPLKEQKRIVEKVNGLFLLCDDLEAKIDFRDNFALLARKSAVDAISTAQTPAELEIAWERIQDNWDVIVGTPDAINSLRQLILSLAAKGKLVNSPERFAGAIATLELSKVCKVSWGNLSLTKSSYIENGPYLAVSAAGPDGRIGIAEHKAFTPVLSAIGARCGTMFMPNEDFTAIKNTMTLQPISNLLDNWYLLYTMMGSILPRRGSAQPFMSKSDIENFRIRVPSLDEQKLIASVVEALLQKCDLLEAKLRDSDKLAEKFSRSVISATA
jgi:restriction endonuclease S subunit